MRCIERAGGLELTRSPILRHLTEQEVDAAVAAQLEQRARQGFGDVSPTVLSRVAEIIARVRC